MLAPLAPFPYYHTNLFMYPMEQFHKFFVVCLICVNPDGTLHITVAGEQQTCQNHLYLYTLYQLGALRT